MPTGARSLSFDNGRAKSFREITGRAPSTATPEDSTLIIIDAQNEYADGLLHTVNVAKTRAAIASLITTYRTAEQANPSPHSNIIHIVHKVPPGAPIFTPNTPLAAEFSEITVLSGEPVIHKEFPGSFTGTDLNDKLKHIVAAGRSKKVVLCGYMAHVCVSMTARQASELGYDVLIAGDAVGDRDIPGAKGEEVTRMVLAELADAIGTVVNSTDIKSSAVEA